MPRRKPEHADQMHARIVKGAEQAILNAGYRGATVDDIAAAADVSVGLLYRYFGSKEALFLSVCRGITDEALDVLAGSLREVDDPHERLRLAVDAFIQSLEQNSWGKLIANAWLEADASDELRALVLGRFDQLRSFAADFLRDAIARGDARPDVDVEGLSLATAVLLEGVVARRTAAGPVFDGRATSAAVSRLLGGALIVDQVNAFAAGAPTNVVNPAVSNDSCGTRSTRRRRCRARMPPHQ
jgi:AcrR family transcriptional regulator